METLILSCAQLTSLLLYHASAAKFADNGGIIIIIMWYQVTVELRLCECYEAMPLGAISEEN